MEISEKIVLEFIKMFFIFLIIIKSYYRFSFYEYESVIDNSYEAIYKNKKMVILGIVIYRTRTIIKLKDNAEL